MTSKLSGTFSVAAVTSCRRLRLSRSAPRNNSNTTETLRRADHRPSPPRLGEAVAQAPIGIGYRPSAAGRRLLLHAGLIPTTALVGSAPLASTAIREGFARMMLSRMAHDSCPGNAVDPQRAAVSRATADDCRVERNLAPPPSGRLRSQIGSNNDSCSVRRLRPVGRFDFGCGPLYPIEC